ncbi:2-methylcitrate dehydratase [Diplodia corticola]|uniref:2-methylcitrate dehydratase n=1 Tax=Diplodia corticola TaxID=236234 RepID=A0A1J9QUX0_9PEZI|nr:2-methylcitrate dehydratase [Diplodia corticola]OJD32193.1 2-methylcitrate dehydratase [Diplodia corticola]
MAPTGDDNNVLKYDQVITDIVDYVYDFEPTNPAAWERAKATFIDAFGCIAENLATSAEVRRLIGPTAGSPDKLPGGVKLPGTPYQLDLLSGAFNIATSIRYLDHNDYFVGAEWGHPSDNLGAILATASVFSRLENRPITLRTILVALTKAYEIQGVFQLRNSFNKVGLDHVILVKLGSTAVSAWLMGLSKDQAAAAVSHAFVDGHSLRTYRHAPNTGPRKGWAAGEAAQRAVQLALLARAGQPGIKSALTAPRWGFYDVLFEGKQFQFPRAFGSWVVENVLFKIYTAEGHAITAVEAAVAAAQQLAARGLNPAADIGSVRVRTQDAGMVIINKQGPLHNAADRDHDMKYMVAVCLLKGSAVETPDYQDDSPWATDPRVERLREKMTLVEDERFTRDYHDLDIKSVANAVQVTTTTGEVLDDFVVELPLGHPRRPETIPAAYAKARKNLLLKYEPAKVDRILDLVDRTDDFYKTTVNEWLDLFAES